jgi:hypothetical protein
MNKSIALIVVTLAFVSAKASTYMQNGKEISKGQAILALAKDPKAEILKIDKIMLDFEKGTLKNIPKLK